MSLGHLHNETTLGTPGSNPGVSITQEANRAAAGLLSGGSSFLRGPHPGLDGVLSQMKRLVKEAKGDPAIRDLAFDITKDIAPDPRTGLANRRDFDGVAEAIYRWGNKNIAYVRDPHMIEWIQTPRKTLERGFGDCDDHVILYASLLESLGIPTRFRVISMNPDGDFEHIFLQYKNQNGEWKNFDTTLHANVGASLPEQAITNNKILTLNGTDMQTLSITPTASRQLGAVDPATAGATVGFGKKIVGGLKSLFGGNPESPADLEKQEIQRQLEQAGFTQFSRMQGFKGDEVAKRDAMQLIASAISANPANAQIIEQWLEGGQVTPNTVTQIQRNLSRLFPSQNSELPTITLNPSEAFQPGGSITDFINNTAETVNQFSQGFNQATGEVTTQSQTQPLPTRQTQQASFTGNPLLLATLGIAAVGGAVFGIRKLSK